MSLLVRITVIISFFPFLSLGNAGNKGNCHGVFSELSHLKEDSVFEGKTEQIEIKIQTKGSVSEWPKKVSIYTKANHKFEDSALGLQVFSKVNESLVYREGSYLGNNNTNHFAEYKAIIRALELASENHVQELILFSNLKLVIDQLNKKSKTRTKTLKPFFDRAQQLITQIPKSYFYFSQEKNKGASSLAKKALKIILIEKEMNEHLKLIKKRDYSTEMINILEKIQQNTDLKSKDIAFQYTISQFLKEEKWKKEIQLNEIRALYERIIEEEKKEENKKPENAPPPFNSWFEVKVFLAIDKKGYFVIPQFKFAGNKPPSTGLKRVYHIDFVIIGPDGKNMAVESDGVWHLKKEIEQRDRKRQQKLEKYGWKFWRIPEKKFQSKPNQTLTELWEYLDNNGIKVLSK